MAINQFCVFCGNRPENKNKEHILPQWLISLTGNPSRVVNFGLDYTNGKVINFSWSNFVAPACERCNSDYADLEGIAKSLLQKLIARKHLAGLEYISLLDWLDKVRIGLWLTYHMIQKNPTDISPSFHINSRIASKDRMLAVYLMQTQNKGMNAIGVESLVFHRMPSCFMLNINNVAILNMSCDYLFSRRCGFPAPEVREILLDGDNSGMLSLDGFTTSRRVMHPILERDIIKPSIHLYQPIMHPDTTGQYQGGYLGVSNLHDVFLYRHTIPRSPNQGVLFSQTSTAVEVIYKLDAPIEYTSVNMTDARPLYEIMAQTYSLQNYCQSLYDARSSDSTELKTYRRRNEMMARLNRHRRNEIVRQCKQETEP